jgi:hypothetical protein
MQVSVREAACLVPRDIGRWAGAPGQRVPGPRALPPVRGRPYVGDK